MILFYHFKRVSCILAAHICTSPQHQSDRAAGTGGLW